MVGQGSFSGIETLEIIRCDKTVNWHAFWRQFTYKCEDSPSTDSVLQNIYVCLSITNVYCHMLKYNVFRQRRPQVKTAQIGHHKESMLMWFWTTLVRQVVSVLSCKCSKGYELEQQTMFACLPVCLSVTSLLSPLFKIWLVQNNNFIYTYIWSVDKAFWWKLIIVIKLCFIVKTTSG